MDLDRIIWKDPPAEATTPSNNVVLPIYTTSATNQTEIHWETFTTEPLSPSENPFSPVHQTAPMDQSQPHWGSFQAPTFTPINNVVSSVHPMSTIDQFQLPSADSPAYSPADSPAETLPQANNEKPKRSPKIAWQRKEILSLVSQLRKAKDAGYYDNDEFHESIWVPIASQFADYRKRTDMKYLKNKWARLKIEFNDVKYILGQPGFGWDDARCMIVAEPAVWSAFRKKCKWAGKRRDAVFPFYDDIGYILGDNYGPGRAEVDFSDQEDANYGEVGHDPPLPGDSGAFDPSLLDPALFACNAPSQGMQGSGQHLNGPNKELSDFFASEENADEKRYYVSEDTTWSNKRPRLSDQMTVNPLPVTETAIPPAPPQPAPSQPTRSQPARAARSQPARSQAARAAAAKDTAGSTMQGQAQARVLGEECLTVEGVLFVYDLFVDPLVARSYMGLIANDGLRVQWLRRLVDKHHGPMDDLFKDTM